MRIALVGYGEVGQILAADLGVAGVRDIGAWDRLFPSSASAPSLAAAASGHVRPAGGMAEALADCPLVISAVTAGNCLEAAREAAALIAPQTLYLDLNSVSPRTKRDAAALIDGAGGRYVEGAVMSPIEPKRIASPILIGGPHAEAFSTLARHLGFSGIKVLDASIGRASATKMCRSVMIKGLEALLAESLLAARRHGVDQAVLESLRDLFPNEDWQRVAFYFITRSLQHGRRRAEEMREVARTLAEVGIDPLMSLACAERQEWAAAHRPEGNGADASLPALLDEVLGTVDA